MRGDPHAADNPLWKRGDSRSGCRRRAPALRRVIGAILLLVAGCGDGETPEKVVERPREEVSGDPPILAEAPWFELPEDWSAAHPTLSPNAEVEMHLLALAEQQAPAHPGDGGGRAWLEAVDPIDDPALGHAATQGQWRWRRNDDARQRPALPAAGHARFEVVYEAGPHGIDVGGTIFLLPEIFWDWSEAQTFDPQAPGYVTAEVIRGAARLVPGPSGRGFLVEGESLRPGDRVRFVYGAGPSGARVDRYAERGAEILFAVDADGDGYRRFGDDTPRLDVLPRRARRLVVHGPAEAAPGAPIRLQLALVDGQGNRTGRLEDAADDAGSRLSGARVTVRALPGSTDATREETLHAIEAWQDGAAEIEVSGATTPGVLRLRVEGRGALEGFAGKAPPIVVREASRRLVWGDLHGHTTLSDGTGLPEDYFRYAREVARLDVVALTDHDHWGPRPLDERPQRVDALFATTDDAQQAGRFVTLQGYEWTSWLHGHRHVLYFDRPDSDAEPRIISSIDPATDRPDELWAALRGHDALTFAHHSAGDPVATDWSFPPDPVLEPVTEISSVHGQSESAEMPSPVHGAIPGWFVLDTLRAGYRLGFIGSGDSHDGHPGLAEIAAGHGGLAGLFVERLDRAAVGEALRRRQTFATNGIRPFFEVSIDGVPMGGSLSPGESADTQRLRIRYEATAPVERVELVRSGRVARIEPPRSGSGAAQEADARLSIDLERDIPALHAGEFHYVRIRQQDGGAAWSSPIFVEADTPATERPQTGAPPPEAGDSARPAR